MIATFASKDEARQFRADLDAYARALVRVNKATLERMARQHAVFDSASKAELVSMILRNRYPLERENEAIHVLHHEAGAPWSACEWCRPQSFADHAAAGVEAIVKASQ